MEEETAVRPNIRIEIQNNFVEEMEVNECLISDGEEGEITDGNEAEDATKDITYTSRPEEANAKKGLWTTAKPGFTTGPSIFDSAEQEKLQERAKRFAFQSGEVKNLTEQDIQSLYESLGIRPGEEKNVRFEAVHMQGIHDTSAEDVLEYFGKYVPSCIEWIDDESCNVVWLDQKTASRALHYLSKPVKGMPVGGQFGTEVVEGEEEKGDGLSILLKNKHREIEMSVEEETGKESGAEVHVLEIGVPVPPGYWRLGVPHHKSKNIFLRFALKTDKKPLSVEKFSKNYRKHGNPNDKGIISQSQKLKSEGIFGRNRDIEVNGSKNPWGNLALNWHEDAKYAEPEYKDPPEPPVKPVSSPMLHRLGFKRALVPEEKEIKPEKEIDKKTKVPRMRMYADEEEEKIKRKRQLSVLKSGLIKLESKSEDLRHMLRLPARNQPEITESVDDKIVVETIDLGSKLKNRKLNVHRDILVAKRQDVRSRLEDRPSVHPDDRPSRNLVPCTDDRAERAIVKPKRHSPQRKEYRKRYPRKKDSDSEMDVYDDGKTSSKVTVVIKKPKTPAVASTIWSRIHSERERLKTVSEGKLRVRSESRSESSESSSESSSSSSGSDSESSPAESPLQPAKRGVLERPGFRNNSLRSRLDFTASEHKSPLRIEISNDHFRKD